MAFTQSELITATALVVITMGIYMVGPVLITYGASKNCGMDPNMESCRATQQNTLTIGIFLTIFIVIFAVFLRMSNTKLL